MLQVFPSTRFSLEFGVRQALGGLALLALVHSCGGGGGGGASVPGPDPLRSSFTADVAFGTLADGVAQVLLTATVLDPYGNPLEGVPLEFRASGYGNDLTQPGLTDADGVALGSLRTTAGETKTVRAVVVMGTTETEIGSLTSEFIRVLPNHFFVRESGTDASTGRTPLDAWRTLGFALSRVGAGDTLHIGAGQYEPVEISTVASSLSPLRVFGDRNGTFTGDSGEVLIDAAGSDYGIRFDGAAHVILRGLTVHGALPGPSTGGGLHLTSTTSTSISVYDSSFYENTRGADIESAITLTIEGTRFSSNFEQGIRLGATFDGMILNNLIYANGGDGLVVEQVSLNLAVGLNTFFRNVGDQIAELSAGTTAFITGNILVEGGSTSINLPSNSQIAGDINLSFANRSVSVTAPISSQSINADPLFMDVFGQDGILGGFGALDDDFRLDWNSPAFDAGIVDARDLTLGLAGPVSALSNHTTGLRDGEGIDQDLINLGFHYPVPPDSFVSAQPGDARVAYVLPRETSLRTSLFSTVDERWGASETALTTNSTARWVVHRMSPTSPEELVAVLADLGSRTELYIGHWDGRRWSDPFDLPALDVIDLANSGERGFDLAYESDSGDALIVHANRDANPLFRTLVNGVLSAATPVFPTALGTGTVLWVELLPEPSGDRIALVALDDLQNLTASVWDGDAWTAPILLGTAVVEWREFHSFDLAWESISGDLLVVWGFSKFAEQARYAILSTGSGIWQTGLQYSSSEAVGSLIRLRSDPTSDRIVAAFGEGSEDDDVVVSIWDGEGFTETREVALFGVPGQHSIQVGWIGNTGRAFALWREPNGNTFERAIFDNNWHEESPVLLPGIGTAVRLEVFERGVGNHTEVILLDSNGSLYCLEVRLLNGAGAWSVGNQGLPLAGGFDASASTQTFSSHHRGSL